MKKWYESKTIWFSILTVLIALAGLFGFADFHPSAQLLEFITLLVGVVNFILRLVTKQAIRR